jgi:hypothetical protein
LKNGDDIVCEVVEIGDEDIDTYLLINPYKVLYMPSGDRGTVQIAFMPWVFSRICDKQEFMISIEDVLLMSDVSEYMIKYYWDTMDGPQEKEEEEITPEEEQELNDLEGENFVNNLLNYLGVNGKRTLH